MLALSGLLCSLPATAASPAPSPRPSPNLSAKQLPLEVASGVYVIQGVAGPPSAENLARNGNIAFVVGPTGVLVWNTGVTHRHGQALIGQILRSVDKPIRLAIISHAFQDVLFGWSAFSELNIPVWMHASGVALMKQRCLGCVHRLTELLGEEEMFQTRLAVPDEILTGSRVSMVIGRKVSIIDSGMSSGPNDLMLFDHETGTLLGGPTVMTDQLLKIRDGRVAGWKTALKQLDALPVKQVIPDYGSPADAGAIKRTSQYLSDLEAAVTRLLKQGVTLADAVAKAPLPAYADWTAYDDSHSQNVHQLYLRLESRFFN